MSHLTKLASLTISLVFGISCSDPPVTPLDTVWSAAGGGVEADRCNGISADGAGNAYVTGEFNKVSNIGQYKLTANGIGNDVFVGKINPDGIFAWAVKAGSIKTDFGKGVIADQSGSSYITGSFEHTGIFGALAIKAFDLRVDAYVAKLDTRGKFIWATPIGGPEEDNGNAIAIDGTGNIFVTGTYRYSMSIGNSTLTPVGDEDFFVVKLNNDGDLVWGVSGGGPFNDAGLSIAADLIGNCYITGYIRGKASFGSVNLSSSDIDDREAFVAKVTGNGKVVWAVTMGGIGSDNSRAITIGRGGNVYATGFYKEAATFGAVKVTSKRSDAFVTKISPTGKFLWTKTTKSDFLAHGHGITTDLNGNIVVSGSFDGTTDFGNSQVLNATGGDVFVAVFDTNGNTLHATSAGGPKMDKGFDVATSGNSIHACGSYLLTADFGSKSLTSAGDEDAFFWKLQGVGQQ